MGTALCRYTLGDASEVELARFLWDTARALWAARRLGLARLLVEMGEELRPSVVAEDVAVGAADAVAGWVAPLAAARSAVVALFRRGGWVGEGWGEEEEEGVDADCGGGGEGGGETVGVVGGGN